MAANLISLQLTEEELTTIRTSATNLNSILKPKLISLTDQQRSSIPKMGDKNVPFVGKTLDYAEKNPQFVPPFLNVPELRIDFTAVTVLSEFYNALYPIVSLISDTIMESGSEAYSASLLFYESIKLAAKMNVPGAKEIADDLGKRFKGQGNFGGDTNNVPPTNPQ